MHAIYKLVALCVVVMLAPSAFALREKTVGYYGYVYGSNGDYCTCKVGPCNPLTESELLGEKTFYCDGTTSAWGVTSGCFNYTTITYGATCTLSPSAAPSTLVKESAAKPAIVNERTARQTEMTVLPR